LRSVSTGTKPPQALRRNIMETVKFQPADRRKGIALAVAGIAVLCALVLLLPTTRHKVHRLLAKALSLPSAPNYQRLAVGDRFTPLSMEPVRGSNPFIKHSPRRPMLINVFTTWCPGCKEEMPALAQFYQRFGNRVDIVGIDQEESPEIVLPFQASYGVNYPVFVDQNHISEKVLSARFIPTTVLVGADNRVLSIHHGPLSYNDFVSMVRLVGHASI